MPHFDTPTPRSKIVSAWGLLAWAAGALFFLVVIFYGVSGWLGKRRWDAYVEEAQVRKSQLSKRDRQPEAGVNEMLFPRSKIWVKISNDLALIRTLAMHPKFQAGNDPRMKIDLAAQLLHMQEQHLQLAGSQLAPAEEIRKSLSSLYAPLWAELSEALQLPRTSWPDKSSQALTLEELAAFVKLSDINAIWIAADLAAGDTAAALEKVRLGVQLTSLAESDDATSSLGTYSFIVSATLLGIRQGLIDHAWDDASLSDICSLLAQLRYMDRYAAAADDLRAGENEWMLAFARGGPGNRFYPGFDPQYQRFLSVIYPRLWTYDDALLCNRSTDAVIAAVKNQSERPFPAIAPPEPRSLFPSLRFGGYPGYRRHAEILNTFTEAALFYDTQLNETIIVCTLERYKLARGTFPATLESLAPDFLRIIPADVMTGDRFHYRTDPEKGYILYSVGLNKTDDGGVIDPAELSIESADWVWTGNYVLPPQGDPLPSAIPRRSRVRVIPTGK